MATASTSKSASSSPTTVTGTRQKPAVPVPQAAVTKRTGSGSSQTSVGVVTTSSTATKVREQDLVNKHDRKLPVVTSRLCVVCAVNKPSVHFPVRPTARCTHPASTCRACLQSWIASSIDSKGWKRIGCPDCDETLQHTDVRRLAAPAIFEKYSVPDLIVRSVGFPLRSRTRYDALTARSALNSIPNFRWCLNTTQNCCSGQIHDNGTDGPIFRCVSCGFKLCVIHEQAWHEGVTCKQYDCRMSEKKRRHEDEASKKKIKETTKKCPGRTCGWNIEKNSGCDHMICTSSEFFPLHTLLTLLD